MHFIIIQRNRRVRNIELFRVYFHHFRSNSRFHENFLVRFKNLEIRCNFVAPSRGELFAGIEGNVRTFYFGGNV